MHPMNFTQVENGPYDLNMYTTHPGKFDMDAGYDSLENIVPFKMYCYVAAMFGICVFSIEHGSFSSHVSWGKQTNSSMGSSLGPPLVSVQEVPSKDECQPRHIYCHRASNYTQ